MDQFSRSTKLRLKFLAWYQILGGIAGILVTIWIIARTEVVSELIMLLFLIAFALYFFSIYCGRLLLTKRYRVGLHFTAVNQILQIISFLFLGYGFMYVSGGTLIVSISYLTGQGDGLKFGFDFGIMSKWRIFFNSDDHSFDLSVNLLAIYLTFFTYQLLLKIEEEKTMSYFAISDQQIDQIDQRLSAEE